MDRELDVSFTKRQLIAFGVSVLALLAIALAIDFGNPFSPATVGFHLNDPKFAFPQNTETVSSNGLIAIVIVAGVIVVGMQWLRTFSHPWHRIIGPLMYIGGFSLTLLGTDLIKPFAGQHRPFFLQVCDPINLVYNNVSYTYNGTTVDATSSALGPWIQSYTCNQTKKSKILEASASFPSGHASISTFVVCVLVEYIQYVLLPFLKEKYSDPDFAPLLNFLCGWLSSWVCFGGFIVSASRWADKYHFIEDICAGGLLGLAIGISYFYFDIALKPSKMKSKI